MEASKLLMIEPVNFGFNPQTAVNNAFQTNKQTNVQEKALEEFNGLVSLLRNNKLDVTVVMDSPHPHTPDSIFPNNWISFHEDNSVFLYPMFAENRRLERKDHVIDAVKEKFNISTIHDLTRHEHDGAFLEGTGSMVLDRSNRIAYAAVSQRTYMEVLHEFCSISSYYPVSFFSQDTSGKDIYHSNVMMSVGNKYVVICMDAIADKIQKEKLKHLFLKTKKEIIPISYDQLNSFAGNMLQLKNTDGELLLVMSTQAYNSLKWEQLKKLEKYNRIIHSPLDTIESCGGGSARCMMAEIFNHPK